MNGVRFFRQTMVISVEVGKDKDHVDVFIGNKPEASNIYIIDQIDPNSGKFDEHKVMLGFDSQAKAKQTYLAAFA